MATAAVSSDRDTPELNGVPETMLWTLHSRANEAMRADGVIHDPKAIEIYKLIDYDFQRSFGRPEPSLAMRSAMFDRVLAGFIAQHGACTIVNLGEGLETQRFRVTAPDCRWYSVDLPEAIAVRERYIKSDPDHRHIPVSVSDYRWLDEVPEDRPVFVSAQGLLMYLDRDIVMSLLQEVAQRFEHCDMLFDVIPRWVSRASLLGGGLRRTLYYKVPPMPWGVNRYRIRPLLRRWLPRPAEIQLHSFPPFPRGPARLLSSAAVGLPAVQYWAPTIVQVSLRP